MAAKSVFISYSSLDSQYVTRIINALEEIGVSYWIAPQMIPAGSNYAREIPQAIKNCTVFLLVLSKKSQTSIWVEKEIDSAICNKKSIIPFQVDSVPLSDMFRFYLNNVQMISYVDDKEAAIEELKRQIQMQISDGEEVQEQKKRILIENSGRTEKTVTKKIKGLSPNRIPFMCEYCGGDVEYSAIGTYKCKSCGKDNYDDFQTIRNYLDKKGATPSFVIARETNVPRDTIEYFFKEESLEIPRNSTFRVSCSKCGAPIRTGTLCDRCKNSHMAGGNTRTDAKWHTSKW